MVGGILFVAPDIFVNVTASGVMVIIFLCDTIGNESVLSFVVLSIGEFLNCFSIFVVS